MRSQTLHLHVMQNRVSSALVLGAFVLSTMVACATSQPKAEPSLPHPLSQPTLVPPPAGLVTRRVSLRQLERDVRSASSLEGLPLGLTDIQGFEWDPQNDELWIIGSFDPAAPPIFVDYFVGALRATQTSQDPGMTLLPQDFSNPDSLHQVVVFPANIGIENTRFTGVLIDADYMIKAMAAAAVDTAVAFDSVVSRYHKALAQCSTAPTSSRVVIRARVWFVPAKPLLRSERLNGLQRIWIDRADVILASEDVLLDLDKNTVQALVHSPLREFAQEFTARFAEFRRLRVFHQLHTMYKLALLAKLLHRLDRLPNRHFWLAEYPLTPYATPRTLPSFTPHTVEHTCWGTPYQYSGTKTAVQIWGGVLIAYTPYLSGEGEVDIPPDIRAGLTGSITSSTFSLPPRFGLDSLPMHLSHNLLALGNHSQRLQLDLSGYSRMPGYFR